MGFGKDLAVVARAKDTAFDVGTRQNVDVGVVGVGEVYQG